MAALFRIGVDEGASAHHQFGASSGTKVAARCERYKDPRSATLRDTSSNAARRGLDVDGYPLAVRHIAQLHRSSQ